MVEIRFCKKHGKCEFVLDTSGRWRCKKCRSEAVQRRRRKIKEMAIEYKGGKCEICGYNKCFDALEFHHINPSEKDFGIGEKGYTRSFEVIKKELDKCMLLCCRCHRELHCESNDEGAEFETQQKENVVVEKKTTPDAKQLLEVFMQEKNFRNVGKHFGVSDNAVRKWCKKYNLPTHTKEMQGLILEKGK